MSDDTIAVIGWFIISSASEDAVLVVVVFEVVYFGRVECIIGVKLLQGTIAVGGQHAYDNCV